MLVDAETLLPPATAGRVSSARRPTGSSRSSSSRWSRSRRRSARRRRRSRRAARLAAGGRGACRDSRLAVLATGPHPTAIGRPPMVRVERYERMKEELGPRLLRQRICGLHVHVSVPDPDVCLRVFEGVVPELPRPPRISANSPFWDGEPTGWRSIRSADPPRDADGWNTARAAELGRLGGRDAGRQSTRRHWDAWPRPEYGTLEVRVMDQPTSVRRTAELVAEVQRLVREAADGAANRTTARSTRGA